VLFSARELDRGRRKGERERVAGERERERERERESEREGEILWTQQLPIGNES
jgi:hypothetical protein